MIPQCTTIFPSNWFRTTGWWPTWGQCCWCTTIDCHHHCSSLSCRLRQESLISHCAWRTGWFQFHPQAQEPASPRLKLWVRHTDRQTTNFNEFLNRGRHSASGKWGYNIQDLWLHQAFVNYFRVAFIQPCCHYIQLIMISDISKINIISIITNISYSPGRRWPEYSSITETNAHECLFSPTSVFDSTWNKRSILQNQTLSR